LQNSGQQDLFCSQKKVLHFNNIRAMTNEDSFFDKVYEVVKLIPKGRVTSYGAIAKFLGAARSSRMVGWAMNNSHFLSESIPAHRVVNRNGLLSGKAHFGTPSEMQRRLELEGMEIKDNCILHFDKVFWDPNKELAL
jgi:methylated-DNA-protein-cysteine methyltransferase-like protein